MNHGGDDVREIDGILTCGNVVDNIPVLFYDALFCTALRVLRHERFSYITF